MRAGASWLEWSEDGERDMGCESTRGWTIRRIEHWAVLRVDDLRGGSRETKEEKSDSRPRFTVITLCGRR